MDRVHLLRSKLVWLLSGYLRLITVSTTNIARNFVSGLVRVPLIVKTFDFERHLPLASVRYFELLISTMNLIGDSRGNDCVLMLILGGTFGQLVAFVLCHILSFEVLFISLERSLPDFVVASLIRRTLLNDEHLWFGGLVHHLASFQGFGDYDAAAI